MLPRTLQNPEETAKSLAVTVHPLESGLLGKRGGEKERERESGSVKEINFASNLCSRQPDIPGTHSDRDRALNEVLLGFLQV